MPEFGNKMIGVHKGSIDMHGTPKTPTWTELETSVDGEATSITVIESTNWKVGDEIVIASTSYDHKEAE